MFLLISLFLAAFVLGCGDVGNDGVEVCLKVGVAAKAFGNGEDAQRILAKHVIPILRKAGLLGRIKKIKRTKLC